jgi:hypothetical protein
MHRRIVTSATYRQERSPQRLEAEVLRDAILAVAGSLNAKTGGPGVKPRIRPELLVSSQRNKWPEVKQEGPEHWRRSVYIYVKRQLPFPMLELFDQPNAAQTCERRDVNVVPTQALVLMNDEFTAEQAGRFADRVLREAGADGGDQVRHAVRLALGRAPASDELTETIAFLYDRTQSYRSDKHDEAAAARMALIDFCHVLLNSNEFAYVD